MKNLFVICALLAMSTTLHAQKFSIKGIVKDATTSENLLSATVFLESAQDSTLIAYSITNDKGEFNITGNTATDKVNFYTSFQGYKPIFKTFLLSANRELDLGTLNLQIDVAQLDGVLVEARKAPIVIKKDTIEFNAKSFDTPADATLEDVMKELPGVEISNDGKITVNGKEVTKLLVNGKEFFGSDPQIALKNLPKEIIDKIQVTESKTEEQKITGEAGDASKAEINITIDEDKNKGFFSRFTAGGGTDERFQLSGIANYFNEDFRLSVLASSNNINSPGFSFDEVYDAVGRGASTIWRNSNGSFGFGGLDFGNGGGGITTSQTAGFNIANDWGKKISVNGNYFYGSNETVSRSDSRSTTFLPDRTFTSASNTTGNSAGDSHRFQSRLDIRPDTLTSFRIAPSYNYRNTNAINSNESESSNDAGNLLNRVQSFNESVSSNGDFSLNTYSNRRFKAQGSFVGLIFNFNNTNNESANDFNSLQETFSGVPQTIVQDQLINQNDESNTITVSPSLRLPLAPKWFIKGSYNFVNRNQNNNRSVFDRDNSNPQGVFNSQLSTLFDLQTTENRPALEISFDNDKLRFDLEGGVNFQSLQNKDLLRATSFDKNFTLPGISSSISYAFNDKTSFYVSYNTNANVPSIQQLTPVENTTNPQNIITGNPDLDVTQSHDVYVSLNSYDWEKGNGFYSGGGVTFTQNQIGTVTLTDADLTRRTTFVNLNDGYNGWFYSNYSRTFKKDKRTLRIETGIDGNLSQDYGFTNGLEFQSNNLSLSPNAGLEWNVKDLFTFKTNYNITFNTTLFNINSIEDQRFTNHNAAIDLTTFWPKNVTFGLRGEYNVFGNITDEFDNDSFVVIGSLGYKFAKDKASLKITAYDLFNQVIDTSRVVTSDFVSDTSSLVLRQYFMASFTYKFTKFVKEEKEDNGIIIF